MMTQRLSRFTWRIAAICAAFLCFGVTIQAQNVTEGALQARKPDGTELGAAPLQRTDVKAEISGFLARVTVKQEFQNLFTEAIEAVYVFPLSQNAAVDNMTMQIGERTTIKGKIMRREEARKVYEEAKQQGKVASLLDQERPNIFTQAIANIMPGEKVAITISYVETLAYEDGTYTFVFPMVVGPRYIPGAPTGAGGTTQVPDASHITPPVAPQRVGYNIAIEVKLDTGVPLDGVASKSHAIDTNQLDAARAIVKLKNENEIPNKDFVLKYDVAGRKMADALLTHRDERGGFFTFILQPPDRVEAKDVNPKEIVFVLDTSGSMSGFPIQKAKEAMGLALANLNPTDTFNLITFAGDTHILFPEPVPASKYNLARAREFLDSRTGSGGTEMMKAIRAALDPSDSKDHLRIVCFMTDGYVGNDGAIISEIQKHPKARVFSFGIGSSVNRFLLDKMAEEGRGEVEYVGLNDDGSAAARRFHERIRNPLLTDLQLDWGNLQVADVYPKRLPDLFSAKPVKLTGRFTKATSGTLRLKGMMAGREVIREIPVNFPETEAAHDTLATLWARARVDELMAQDYAGIQRGTAKPEVKEPIIQVALEFRLLTQFTSFVAVEERIVNQNGTPVRVEVPLEQPEGMSRAEAGNNQITQGLSSFSSNTSPIRVGEFLTPNLGSTGGMFPRSNLPALQSVVKRDAPGNAPASPVSPAQPIARSDRAAAPTTGGKSSATTTAAKPAPPSKAVEPTAPPVVMGKMLNQPLPMYPAEARTDWATETITLYVLLDEAGRVMLTKAANPKANRHLLRVSEAAAASALFVPAMQDKQAVKAVWYLRYRFAPELPLSASEANDEKLETLPTVAEMLKDNLTHKLHPVILQVAQNTQNGYRYAFVHNGMAEVVITVSELTPQVIAKVGTLGLVQSTKQQAGKIVAQIPLEKLADLTLIAEVRYVAPPGVR